MGFRLGHGFKDSDFRCQHRRNPERKPEAWRQYRVPKWVTVFGCSLPEFLFLPRKSKKVDPVAVLGWIDPGGAHFRTPPGPASPFPRGHPVVLFTADGKRHGEALNRRGEF